MATISFSLTVSEGKRLIAKGVLKYKPVVDAMENHSLIIGSGTTNCYIAEELLGKDFQRTNFVTGRTLPRKTNLKTKIAYTEKPIRVRQGKIERVDEMAEALAELKKGDVIFKGANVISGDGEKAGILIGHTTGGGIGAMIGTVVSRRVRLIHPVGLEKCVPMDIESTARIAAAPSAIKGPTLFVTPGEVFNECSAIEALYSDVKAYPYAAGGIAGAEGAVWLLIEGPAATLEKIEEFVGSVYGEPPFV